MYKRIYIGWLCIQYNIHVTNTARDDIHYRQFFSYISILFEKKNVLFCGYVHVHHLTFIIRMCDNESVCDILSICWWKFISFYLLSFFFLFASLLLCCFNGVSNLSKSISTFGRKPFFTKTNFQRKLKKTLNNVECNPSIYFQFYK